MRLRILSDLHLEFGTWEMPQVHADVVVLAGDVHLGLRGLAWIQDQWPNLPVVYVPGNHEYYGEAMPRLTDKLRAKAAASQVSVLHDDVAVIDGVTFLGATLWTDFGLWGDPLLGSREAGEVMNDYRRIRVSPSFRRLRPGDTAAEHLHSRRWLEARLSEPTSGPVVVVTHHAPSALSLGQDRFQDAVGAAYASNLAEMVEGGGAALWVHGHIHRAADYFLGLTQVICNPRGYPDDPVAGFNPTMVVEI